MVEKHLMNRAKSYIIKRLAKVDSFYLSSDRACKSSDGNRCLHPLPNRPFTSN